MIVIFMVNIYRFAESLRDIAFEYYILQVEAGSMKIFIFLFDVMLNFEVACLTGLVRVWAFYVSSNFRLLFFVILVVSLI